MHGKEFFRNFLLTFYEFPNRMESTNLEWGLGWFAVRPFHNLIQQE